MTWGMVYGINLKKHKKHCITYIPHESKYFLRRGPCHTPQSTLEVLHQIYNTNVYMLCTSMYNNIGLQKKIPHKSHGLSSFFNRNDHVGIPLSNTSMSKEKNWLLVLTRPKYTRHFNRSSQVSIAIWNGPIANISFLHFLKTNVEPIHILVS